MPGWLLAATRTGLQGVWGILVSWGVARGVDVPADPPVWVDALVVSAAMSGVTALVHATEHRAGVLGVLGRALMMGVPPRGGRVGS